MHFHPHRNLLPLAAFIYAPAPAHAHQLACLRRAGYATLATEADMAHGSSRDGGEGEGEEKHGRGHGHGGRTMHHFPFPAHANPTPHEIFHLRPGATQAEIKARYFDLVRAHHPDTHAHAPSSSSSTSPALAHARFRAIKAAYDFLTGRALSPDPNARPAPEPRHFDEYAHELARRRRAYYAGQGRYRGANGGEGGEWHRPGFADGFGPRGQKDEWDQEGWRERAILALGVMALAGGLFPDVPGTLFAALVPSGSVAPLPYSPSSPSTPAPRTPTARTTPGIDPVSTSTTASPSTPSSTASPSGLSIPFVDLDRGHRAAASALAQARVERRELGPERREGVRRRVREMVEAEAAERGEGDRDEEMRQEPAQREEGESAGADEVQRGDGSASAAAPSAPPQAGVE